MVEKAQQSVLGDGDIASVHFRGELHEKRALQFRCDLGQLFGQVCILVNGFHGTHYLSDESFSQ
jgi:hypothetical protein